ncbi:hypothetical protein HK096_007673, partial [Nowakowskiella sp. JEL0078]
MACSRGNINFVKYLFSQIGVHLYKSDVQDILTIRENRPKFMLSPIETAERNFSKAAGKTSQKNAGELLELLILKYLEFDVKHDVEYNMDIEIP